MTTTIARPQLWDRFAAAKEAYVSARAASQNQADIDLYTFVIDQCDIGMVLSSYPYDPDNVNMDWDDVNIVNDRYRGSLSGCLAELAMYLMKQFAQYGTIVPVMSRRNQVDLGLDFICGSTTHQVKSGVMSLSGGAIEVTKDLFNTTATFIHLLTRRDGNVIWYRGSAHIWRVLFNAEVARYEGEKQPTKFTLEREDILRSGIIELTTYDWASS